MAKPKKKFDAKKEAEALVAKYVTTRTHASGYWNDLYEFAEHCIRLGYKKGKADGKS